MKIGKAVQKDTVIFRQSSRWKAVIDAVQELSPELALPVTLDKKEEAIAYATASRETRTLISRPRFP